MSFIRRIPDALHSVLMKRAGLLRVLALVASVVALTAAAPHPAEACSFGDMPSCVAMIFVKIFQLLTALMGWILVLEVEALIRVAQYFNFVSPGPTAVQIGWVVTRDLANMFFIVILLIIAFGTILGSSTYHYSKNLPRLLIMAVVINFSKTICGLFIDMGQVVMLTFVNGFKETAAGNFMNAYQINKLLALGNTEGSYSFGMVIAMMFAFILAAIAVCVTLVLLIMLLFRVVMLWVLIILSPIAFLASAIPRGGDYYAEWWKEFKKYIITGPIIAFFMWLALASVQQVGDGGFAKDKSYGDKQGGFAPAYAGQGETAAAGGKGDSKIPTEAGTADTIMNMIIAICIMFAGLKFASESGAAGAGVAKSVRGGLEKYGRAAGRWGLGAATAPVTGAAKSVGGRAMSVVGAGLAKTPFVGRTPLGALGRRMALKGEDLEETQRKKREKTFASSAKDLARFNPAAAGSRFRLRGATAEQKFEAADEATKNPEVMAAMKKSGAAKSLLTDMEAAAKKDPSKKGALDTFKKAAWSEISDPKEQSEVLQKMTGEEARKYMKPEDLNSLRMADLSKSAITDVLANGKDDQTTAVMAALENSAKLGTLDSFFAEKRMSFSDIPSEAFATAGNEASELRSATLAAAMKDPSLMKRLAEDPKMRQELAPRANGNVQTAADGLDRAQKLKQAIQLGGIRESDITPQMEMELAQLSFKDLADMQRSAPSDNDEIQRAVAKAINAGVEHGSTELSQKILNNPAMSELADGNKSAMANKSSAGYTSSLTSAAGNKVADLDRQRKQAEDAGESFEALGFAAAAKELRGFAQEVKDASKDLAAAEATVTTARDQYLNAQKSNKSAPKGAPPVFTDAQMKAFAANIEGAMKAANGEKTKLAQTNERLKTET